MTRRIMYDSIYPQDIPRTAQLVAGYVDGEYAWTADDWALFPDAAHVRISLTGYDYPQASVLDVELLAATPAAARQFVVDRDGFRPGSATVYVQFSSLQQVVRACRGLPWNLWLAYWTADCSPPSDAQIAQVTAMLPSSVRLVAWQYRSTSQWDESLVLDPDWHPAP
jgi:hypothetical protein